jgi:hypothetical protein
MFWKIISKRKEEINFWLRLTPTFSRDCERLWQATRTRRYIFSTWITCSYTLDPTIRKRRPEGGGNATGTCENPPKNKESTAFSDVKTSVDSDCKGNSRKKIFFSSVSFSWQSRKRILESTAHIILKHGNFCLFFLKKEREICTAYTISLFRFLFENKKEI